MTQAEMAALIEPVEASIRRWAHKRYRKSYQVDFVDGAVNYALVRCARDYRTDRGATFRTYVGTRLPMLLVDYGRQVYGWRTARGAAIEDEYEMFPDEMISEEPDPAKVAEKAEEPSFIELIGMLRGRLALICTLYYRGGLTLREIGLRLDRSEGRIGQLKMESLRRLREYWGGKGMGA